VKLYIDSSTDLHGIVFKHRDITLPGEVCYVRIWVKTASPKLQYGEVIEYIRATVSY
jgi:hypothetical protein